MPIRPTWPRSALAAADDGRLAVVWVEPDAFNADIFAVFYDPAAGLWGEPRPLTGDDEVEKFVATAFFGDALIALYNRTPVAVRQRAVPTASGGVQSMPVPELGLTDLYVTRHPRGSGVGLVDRQLHDLPVKPRAG